MPVDMSALRAAHDRFLTHLHDEVEAVLYEAGNVALREVLLHPGFKPRTGALQKATTFRVVRGSNGRVLRIQNKKSYAPSIDTGARAHRIPAIGSSSSKILRFIGRDGRYVFRRSVNHPGNRAYFFLKDAQDVAGSWLHSRLESGMRRCSSITY